MKHLSVKPANHIPKEPFQFRPVHDPQHTAHSGKTGFGSARPNHPQSEPPKIDSTMQDFFGALNY